MRFLILLFIPFLWFSRVDAQVCPTAPTAAFTSIPACLGYAVTLTDGSIAVSGDPIVSWQWFMPGGVPNFANTQNAVTTYSTAGTHTVTLIVTTQSGCADTILQQVLVYALPVANFTSATANGITSFTDLSVSTDGNIVSWTWTFTGGTPSVSTTQNPSPVTFPNGTYAVCLTVVTNYACSDTHCDSVVISSVGERPVLRPVSFTPNPMTDRALLQTEEPLRNGIMIVMDHSGRKVFQYENLNGSSLMIERSGLPAGLYIVLVGVEGKWVAGGKMMVADGGG